MLLTDYKSFLAQPISSSDQILPELIVRRLGLQDYEPIYRSMQYLAQHNNGERSDEVWLLSHKPVYTQGQAGKAEHILSPGEIPVRQIDRGGQVTYHGPGQLVVYLLINVKRRKLGVRNLVDVIEASIIETLTEYGISSSADSKAPGVYVNGAKIAALGLRIKNGLSYHGLSLNIDMDLKPYANINPCGFEDLQVTQMANFTADKRSLMMRVSSSLSNNLLVKLGYDRDPIEQKKQG